MFEAEFLLKVRAGVFRVDSDGSVWRLKTISRTGRLIDIEPRRAETLRSKGYLEIRLGKRRSIKAHRAVYVVACGPLDPHQELNHETGVRSDNRPEKLEIVTRSENIQHSYDVLGRPRQQGVSNGQHKLDDAAVRQIRSLKGSAPSRAVARAFGVAKTTVTDIWSGNRWQHVIDGPEAQA